VAISTLVGSDENDLVLVVVTQELDLVLEIVSFHLFDLGVDGRVQRGPEPKKSSIYRQFLKFFILQIG
jgi:hypothetical protein